jgi:hypothetical protein
MLGNQRTNVLLVVCLDKDLVSHVSASGGHPA